MRGGNRRRGRQDDDDTDNEADDDDNESRVTTTISTSSSPSSLSSSTASTTEIQFTTLTSATTTETTSDTPTNTSLVPTPSARPRPTELTAPPAVITNIAAQTAVKASAIVLPIFLGIVLVAIILSFLFRSKLQRIWKQCIKQRIEMRRGLNSNTDTIPGRTDNPNSMYNAAYSVIEKEVIVSSLPAGMSIQQRTVPVDESYSVLNRENNVSCNKINVSDNSPQYDLLNHNKRVSMTISHETNVYSSANPANCQTVDQENYSTANLGGVYSSVNPGGACSTANSGSVYSSVNPGGAYSSANLASGADHGNVYSSANQNTADNTSVHGNYSSLNEKNHYSSIEQTK